MTIETTRQPASTFNFMPLESGLFGSRRGMPVFEADGGGGDPNPEPNKPSDPPVDPPAGDPKPSDDAAKLLKEVMKLKGQLREKDTAIARFDGIDPDAVRTMLTEAKAAKDAKELADRTAEEERLRAAGDYDALRRRMASEHETAMTALRGELEGKVTENGNRASTLEAQIHELTVGQSFLGSPYIRDNLVLTPAKARRVFESHFDVVDGKVQAFSKPRGSDDREPLVNASGVSLSFDDALKAIVEADPERDDMLRSKIKPGTGARSTGAGVEVPVKKPELRGLARIKAGLDALAK